MKNVPGSGTLEILSLANELEEEGKDIIHLEVGQPDFDTPQHIKDKANEALNRGETGYTSSTGIPELREAISQYLQDKEIERESEEIIATPGAKFSLFAAMTVALDPEDEIIVPSPCWTYEGMIRIINAEPVFVEAPENNQFKLDPEKVKEKITQDTKMLLLNYPNNPTGTLLDDETLNTMADLSVDHDFWILTDEVYERLVYGKTPKSVASFSKCKDRVIYINGFSKTYAMTGWRLGYTAAPEKIIAEMVKIQQNSTTCPTAFVQFGGLAALEGPQNCVQDMVDEYKERRNLIVDGLNSIEGISCVKPEGAFYVFPNIEKLGIKSMKFCKQLLKDAGVAATPGSAFGPTGEGNIRLSYANSKERIKQALERIKNMVSSL
ncbi:hypothetical protein AKJ50_00860 [candidate division MSBL1 archaeon SCGC-AAA382A13]|uniref:Aminotransferase n=2 Tax=candidate division MSBL1 TaxID=215777 RepID=A0A133VG31_9EURY|nr:hypothetical protein AKJ49_00910 [candidate division MSBL1 archaeon SCGC-AAA382A03]KXB05487.1 hypothetical protein AKJ50_00860 [candidate division MSBL1 archaeon SCGC-AAA382A13]